MSNRYFILGFISQSAEPRFRKAIPGLDWYKIAVPMPEEMLSVTDDDPKIATIMKAMPASDVMVEWKDGKCCGAIRLKANNLQVPNDMLKWIESDTGLVDLPETSVAELEEELPWITQRS